jgi:hypothetical protein
MIAVGRWCLEGISSGPGSLNAPFCGNRTGYKKLLFNAIHSDLDKVGPVAAHTWILRQLWVVAVPLVGEVARTDTSYTQGMMDHRRHRWILLLVSSHFHYYRMDTIIGRKPVDCPLDHSKMLALEV